MTEKEHKPLVLWLAGCAALVVLMVLVGAITRLTDSGLSITEWKPVTGIVPPLNNEAWTRAFDLYRQSPEFQKQNFWMELGDFKKIFFWEWLHRFLGRLIGLAYALPLAFFWLRKKIAAGYHAKFLGVLALGGLQGLMGWVMVQSGLVDRPDVSHFRLAAHLILALIIFASLVWLALSLRPLKKYPHAAMHTHAIAALGIFALTVCWGAFTAGLDAGLIYNETFPKMGGQWIPAEIAASLDLLQNPAGVQFIHRWLAITTLCLVLGLWLHGAARRNTYLTLHLLGLVIVLQAGLGIATLLSTVWLPLAVLHQAGAVIVLLLLLINLHQLRS